MLNFQLDDEQKMLTDAIGRYADEMMRKVFRDADEEGVIPAEVVQAGWERARLAVWQALGPESASWIFRVGRGKSWRRNSQASLWRPMCVNPTRSPRQSRGSPRAWAVSTSV